ncbi:glycosyltransferase [Algoriphagus zhangzhouensis]|uniref:Glycosyltransferase involved in cell wall bisynthesis n=1 Tax=Algoriphagus zhangzhouensis TaxID=1073327 RepID=A0A1M7ZL23_9BACT|nr:glycosyltransferase [Algoriphagus zhangzhouensis]TDY42863.1 glycosyltransferase involved in cell wall biosynthesis [Algoriphagus zhangzhouensis]SHO65376.1 Glycosyltransferase involved in cell wall bisynthesis [Algoriphagus zhangzhouensis]
MKIKVLHLIKSLGRGGAEKLIPETALVHNQSRFEFHCLYFYHQKENIADELEAAGIQVHLIPSGNLGLFFQVNKVRDFIKKNEFDIIHAHLPWAGILARFVGSKLNIPIVYTEHNTWDRYNKLSYWGNRLTFKKQDVAIAVSNEVVLSMQLNSIIDPYQRGGRMKVKVVQNGVNTEVFRKYEIRNEKLEIKSSIPSSKNSDLKSILDIPKDSKVIGKVAVFRDQKRLWLWVEIAIRILKKNPEVHFLLVGDGEWRFKLEEQISKSGLIENFHLVGVKKDVIPYLNIMDIYLSSSEFEGLPIAMLEAMACEVPVVATRAGGIGEVIQHGKQGFICEVNDWEELEDFCLKILAENDLHRSMSLAARQQVLEKFSMKKMVGELEQVYNSVFLKLSKQIC